MLLVRQQSILSDLYVFRILLCRNHWSRKSSKGMGPRGAQNHVGFEFECCARKE